MYTDRNLAVRKEELDLINKTSIDLYKQDGYLSGLDIFHQLHCLVGKPASYLVLSFDTKNMTEHDSTDSVP